MSGFYGLGPWVCVRCQCLEVESALHAMAHWTRTETSMLGWRPSLVHWTGQVLLTAVSVSTDQEVALALSVQLQSRIRGHDTSSKRSDQVVWRAPSRYRHLAHHSCNSRRFIMVEPETCISILCQRAVRRLLAMLTWITEVPCCLVS